MYMLFDVLTNFGTSLCLVTFARLRRESTQVEPSKSEILASRQSGMLRSRLVARRSAKVAPSKR